MFLILLNFILNSTASNLMVIFINGSTAVELPASVCIAEIVIRHIEKLIITQLNKILFLHHYIHDIFIIADAHYLHNILEYTNSICLLFRDGPDIDFTGQSDIDIQLDYRIGYLAISKYIQF